MQLGTTQKAIITNTITIDKTPYKHEHFLFLRLYLDLLLQIDSQGDMSTFVSSCRPKSCLADGFTDVLVVVVVVVDVREREHI